MLEDLTIPVTQNNFFLKNDIIDVSEQEIWEYAPEILQGLLIDRTKTERLREELKTSAGYANIFWATSDYADTVKDANGNRIIDGYQYKDEIKPENIIGHYQRIIMPRVLKNKQCQLGRTKEKAEVFTPSKICNAQNNFVENAWFEPDVMPEAEHDNPCIELKAKRRFSTEPGKTWQDYVNTTCLEITCGEAPYLVSRYDTVTGEAIDIDKRIGLLDRKLRAVSENADSEPVWYVWAKKAFQNTYGFEWQGDNVLLARENLLFTFIDYYKYKFSLFPPKELLKEMTEIISWNIWQMDGLKYVIPDSCVPEESAQMSLFNTKIKAKPCTGCAKNIPFAHTGIYCKIKDWKTNKILRFVDLLNNNEM